MTKQKSQDILESLKTIERHLSGSSERVDKMIEQEKSLIEAIKKLTKVKDEMDDSIIELEKRAGEYKTQIEKAQSQLSVIKSDIADSERKRTEEKSAADVQKNSLARLIDEAKREKENTEKLVTSAQKVYAEILAGLAKQLSEKVDELGRLEQQLKERQAFEANTKGHFIGLIQDMLAKKGIKIDLLKELSTASLTK